MKLNFLKNLGKKKIRSTHIYTWKFASHNFVFDGIEGKLEQYRCTNCKMVTNNPEVKTACQYGELQ